MANLTQNASSLASTYILVILTVEVCFAIVYPIRHQTVFNKRLIFIAVALTWVCSIAYPLGFYVDISKVVNGLCYASYGWARIAVAGSITNFMVKLIVPILCYIACYVRIAIFLQMKAAINPINTNIRLKNFSFNRAKDRDVHLGLSNDSTIAKNSHQAILSNDNAKGRNNRQLNSSNDYARARNNVAITLFYTLIIHICTSAGTQTLVLLTAFGYIYDSTSVLVQILQLALYSNSCINPFIYLIKYERFREAVMRNLRIFLT